MVGVVIWKKEFFFCSLGVRGFRVGFFIFSIFFVLGGRGLSVVVRSYELGVREEEYFLFLG